MSSNEKDMSDCAEELTNSMHTKRTGGAAAKFE
jgi:hypothetical protein